MHDTADFEDVAVQTTAYLIENVQEVTCLTALAVVGTHGGSTKSRINNGPRPVGFPGPVRSGLLPLGGRDWSRTGPAFSRIFLGLGLVVLAPRQDWDCRPEGNREISQ